MVAPETIRNRLLTVIAAILIVAALQWSYPVTMPLVVAVFVIAAAWPIKPWLDQVLPSSLSYVGTVLALFLILAGSIAVIYFGIAEVGQTFVQNQEKFRALYDSYAAWAQERGLPVLGGEGGYDRLVAIARVVFWQVYAVLGYFGFIAVLVVMGLPEVPALAAKFRAQLDTAENRKLVETAARIGEKFRQYIGITVLTSIITGIASSALAFAVGLDLVLLWGVLNFLLNFIPVIGNIIGIVPPVLYALIQFEGWTMPIVVFAGFALLQITISNVIYPMLQGRGMGDAPGRDYRRAAFLGMGLGNCRRSPCCAPDRGSDPHLRALQEYRVACTAACAGQRADARMNRRRGRGVLRDDPDYQRSPMQRTK